VNSMPKYMYGRVMPGQSSPSARIGESCHRRRFSYQS
jgi:hypothetical protein